MRFTPRLLTGVAIIAFWLAMTGALAWRELAPTAAWLPAAEADRAGVSDETVTLGIYLADGTPAGRLHWQQTPRRRDGRDGVELAVDARLELALMGKPTGVTVAGEAWRPLAGEDATFRFDVRSGGHALEVAGALADGELHAEVTTAGETFALRRRLAGGWAPSIGFGAPLRLPPLEVGRSYRIASFDPITLGAGTALVRCVGVEMRTVGGREIATKVVEIDGAGLRSRAWIDDRGAVVRAETPLGLVFEVVPENVPGTAPTGTAPTGTAPTPAGGDLLAHTAVRPRGIRPFRGARRLEVAIGGLDETAIPHGDSQERAGPGRYSLRAAAPPARTGVATPRDEARPALRPHLAAGPFVQADHPRIRAQAASIVGGERDPWQRATLLGRWVFEALDKEVTASVPSALEVLRTRRGDCNEHTVLYAALARAAGLPTRIAIGLVWSDELEGFYYHAWPEVWIERWIGLDPTLGQDVADATHLRLLDGGIEAWPRLLPYLGRIELTVLEVE